MGELDQTMASIMKKLILIFPALLMLGCSVQKEVGCCEADEHQCDELYPYYNCPDPVPVYHYRDYKRTWSNSYTPGYNSYYPNTQTVYYVPVQECIEQPVNNVTTISRSPRPSSLGEYRERDSKPVNNNRKTTQN